MSDSVEWREGDIALRCGWGMESRAVTANGRSTYSHAGLLHYDSVNSIWQVVHAVPGEDEPEYLKAEPLAVFYCPERARSGAWFRVNCSDSIARQATKYALRKVAEQVVFDNSYLLEDTTMLYCTELVWRSYLTVGIDVSGGYRHDAPRIFSKEGECIFPGDLEKSETTLYVKPLKTIINPKN
ncbi:MAG: hypothetical protein IJT12_04365 [Paludibacteraceae bacterium]|nr:hypothetical protein [Paludibacteraceae bacterium]